MSDDDPNDPRDKIIVGLCALVIVIICVTSLAAQIYVLHLWVP